MIKPIIIIKISESTVLRIVLSILNDCKYGCSVHDGNIGISMLKSATYPNPEADKEFHEFTFSLFPHVGDWRNGKTVAEAYQLNNPLKAVIKTNHGGSLLPEFSFASTNSENVVIEVVKKAEDSEDFILRLYECYNRRTEVVLSFYAPLVSVTECNLMEEEDSPVSFQEEKVMFMIKPYEIKTFKIRFL